MQIDSPIIINSLTVSGVVDITDNLTVSGDTQIDGMLILNEDLYAYETAYISNDLYAQSTAYVAEDLYVTGDIYAYGLVDGVDIALLALSGVAGGNSHNHAGGDGAQIDHGSLDGLADDDHSQYVLATPTNVLNQIAYYTANRTIGSDSDFNWNPSLNLMQVSGSMDLNGRIYSSAGTLNLGTVAVPSHTLQAGAVILGSDLEVNGGCFFDSTCSFYSTFGVATNISFSLGSTVPAGIDGLGFRGINTIKQGVIHVGDQVGTHVVFVDEAARGDDYAHDDTGIPTLYIHSQTRSSSATDQWMSCHHNTISGVIQTGIGVLSLGTISTTDHGLSSGDVILGGKLEVNGSIYADANIWTSGSSFYAARSGTIYLNIIASQPDDGAKLAIGPIDGTSEAQANNSLSIVQAKWATKDFDHDILLPNPTLFIHSSTDPDTNNTQYLSFTHNTASGVITTGVGDLALLPQTGLVRINQIEANNYTGADRYAFMMAR